MQNSRFPLLVALAFTLIASRDLLARGSRTRLEARLAGETADPLASGKASYESRRGRVRLSVEVEDVSAADTARVVINGIELVQTIAISQDALRTGDLNLEGADLLQLGIVVGSSVEVLGPNGDLLLSGRFAIKVSTAAPPAPAPTDPGTPGSTPPAPSGERLRLEGRLLPAPGVVSPASGKARFESENGRLRFTVEVEDVVTTPQVTEVTVEVIIGGAVVPVETAIAISQDATRGGDLNLELAPDSPLAGITAGTIVNVRAGGSLLLTGALQAR